MKTLVISAAWMWNQGSSWGWDSQSVGGGGKYTALWSVMQQWYEAIKVYMNYVFDLFALI